LTLLGIPGLWPRSPLLRTACVHDRDRPCLMLRASLNNFQIAMTKFEIQTTINLRCLKFGA